MTDLYEFETVLVDVDDGAWPRSRSTGPTR